MKRVFVASACRTPIGGFGGTLAPFGPVELGAFCAKDCLRRAAGGAELPIDEVIVGNVLGAGHGMNISRQVAIKSGLPVTTPAYTINKVCGSGLKAVTLAASEISSGAASAMLAGGVESMSQAGYISMALRAGARMGHVEMRDLIIQDGLSDAFHACHMGITAENLASRFNITREAQDRFALESQSKALESIEAGHFKEEIVPVSIEKRGKQIGLFDKDEHPRANLTLEALAGLKPAFKPDGTVTAGNASGINDGAAMLTLVSEEQLKKSGITPLAEILGWASAGVDPAVMGIGPVEAVKALCKRTSTRLEDVDLIEANEAFAAQALAVNRLLEWDASKINICGGAIALGHPIGASGARILVTLIHQLRRTGKRLGLATLCVGGGQGIAVLVRREG